MHKTYYLILIITLFFSGVFSSMASAQITVSPETIHLYLTGGDVVTEQITITWKGEAVVVAFIETEITPDGEGINVTYSEDPVVLYPDTPKTIDMTIATAINIVPGNYTITTLVFTEIEKVIEYRGGGGTTTVYETIETENLTRINMLLDIIWQLSDELNATKGNYTEHMSLLTAIINTLGELTDSIEDMLLQEPEKGEEDKWLPFIVFLAIVYIILIVIMVRMGKRIRVLESQRIKEVKENEPENK